MNGVYTYKLVNAGTANKKTYPAQYIYMKVDKDGKMKLCNPQ
jgi:hypothetical protein